MARCRRQFGRDRIRDLSISKLLLTGDQSRPAQPLQGLEFTYIRPSLPPEPLPPISKTAIARPRQERFFLPPGAIRDLTGLADPGYYADYLCQTKS